MSGYHVDVIMRLVRDNLKIGVAPYGIAKWPQAKQVNIDYDVVFNTPTFLLGGKISIPLMRKICRISWGIVNGKMFTSKNGRYAIETIDHIF